MRSQLTFSLASGLFGAGIYTTDHAASKPILVNIYTDGMLITSSEADGYYKDKHGNNTRCVLLSIVAAGNTEPRYGQNPLPPSPGFQSVSPVLDYCRLQWSLIKYCRSVG